MQPTLHALWDGSDLLPAGGDWAKAMAVLDDGRDFDRGERWGVYNIQRLYLDFLEALGLREETAPRRPGADANWSSTSSASSARRSPTSRQIYFNTEPQAEVRGVRRTGSSTKHPATTRSPTPTSGTRRPTPSRISTVHQAKGMQWPAVFLPCLRKNRFPVKAARRAGPLPRHPGRAAIDDPDRYRGTVEDETRLFYVAVTRAQKYLFVTFSPDADNQLYKKRSAFFDHCARQQWFSTRDTGVPADDRGSSRTPEQETPNVTLSFSELKYLFECPYQFKLRFLYGFNPPHPRGARLREGPARRAGRGPQARARRRPRRRRTRPRTSSTGTCTPRTRTPSCRQTLHDAAVKSVERYLDEHGATISTSTVHSEKQIQVHVAPGITVDGRIDLSADWTPTSSRSSTSSPRPAPRTRT